jgi:uncharacterized protein YegP (UPF0339 family)
MQRIIKKGQILLYLISILGTAGIKEDIAKTIVRVKSGGKVSTGFFWKNGNTILTTFHSIGNPSSIEVYIPITNKWETASIAKTYKNGDLVQLRVQTYTSFDFIKESYNSSPPTDTRAFTIGYNSGNISYQDRNFTVGFLQGNTLKDILPSKAEDEIQKLSFPSLDIQIVYLQGNLLHGFSGSPVVDYNGKLMGVADGGLENGASSISWCIHANVIPTLENSFETISWLTNANSETLFAAEEYTEKSSLDIIQYGKYKLRKIKTREFRNMNQTGGYTSADEMGLNQLLQKMNLSQIPYSNFVYDVYLEENTGATIVLPSGMILTLVGEYLLATSADSQYRFKIRIEDAVNQTEVQSKSLLFENTIPDISMPYFLDTRLSFLGPITRLDNTIINRKAFYNTQFNKYFFEAFAVKNGTLLSIAVELSNGCYLNNLFLPEFFNKDETAKYNLAVQLTTFSY